MEQIELTVSEVSKKLKNIVSDQYIWPSEVGHGYSLEFIWHQEGVLILDFLNKENAMFWSEARSTSFETPYLDNGEPLTWRHLKQVGIPFMS